MSTDSNVKASIRAFVSYAIQTPMLTDSDLDSDVRNSSAGAHKTHPQFACHQCMSQGATLLLTTDHATSVLAKAGGEMLLQQTATRNRQPFDPGPGARNGAKAGRRHRSEGGREKAQSTARPQHMVSQSVSILPRSTDRHWKV